MDQFYTLTLPLWSSFLILGLMVGMFYGIAFMDFLNLTGEAVLSFKLFLEEFERKTDHADFGKLVLGAKKINELAKAYNIQVSPHKLARGMTISFLKNRKATRKEIDDLIEWIENSTKQENFKKFCKVVKKYTSIAERSSEEGIKEKAHWTFERTVEICKVIVIPIAVAFIIYIVPKILEVWSS